ncbi:MAG: Competence protein ComEC/Rec2-related protein [Myxococcaceae bacterium]|nr:Competence protein ComEC/Rec2-related protein [Myxococcaceae bacterium]
MRQERAGKCADFHTGEAARPLLGLSAMLLSVLTASLLAVLSAVALGWLPTSTAWLTGAGILCSVASVALLRGRPLVWFLVTLLATVSWAALLAPSPARVDIGDLHDGRGRGLARLTFEVQRGGCSDDGCWCEAELLACSALEPHSCVAPGALIGVASASELPLGATITALGSLRPRVTFYNPAGTAAWPDTRAQVQASLEPGSQPRIDHLSLLDAWVARVRNAVRVGLQRSLHAPHAGIARALILGEGAAVERSLNDAIRNAGVSHVLAVSGMHVTLLVGALVTCLRALWLRTPLALHWEARRVAAAHGVLLAPLVARLCGASPSAVRAAWTSTLMYLIVALGLRPSALAVSSFVVAVYAAACPRDALHPGFVLSVLATAALLSHRPAQSASSVLSAARESLRAWLSTAPFLLLCFGQTSLVALLANVALIPLGTALVPLVALHVASLQLQLSSLVPSAALFELTSGAFVEAARFCAGLDPGLSLPPLTVAEVLALSVVAGAFMLQVSLRTRGYVLLVASLVALVSEWSLRHALGRDELRVTFLDVGQGDAVLIESGGQAALIDAGGSLGGGPDPGKLAVLPLLRARRIDRLALVVLSHPHPDHYGGLVAVLDALPVGELWDTGQDEAEAESADSAVGRLLAQARARGSKIKRPGELCGRTHALGKAELAVLAPCPSFELTRGPNDNSFVLRLVHGAHSFLFTGDVEREAEAALSQSSAALVSDVLKVGHHGSRSSSSDAFLARVSPWLAIVSAGRANRFGHPHPEVEQRLSKRSHVLRTDLVGGIEVRSDGTRMSVKSTLDGRVLSR